MPPKPLRYDEQCYEEVRRQRKTFKDAADRLFQREDAIIAECSRKEDFIKQKLNELRGAENEIRHLQIANNELHLRLLDSTEQLDAARAEIARLQDQINALNVLSAPPVVKTPSTSEADPTEIQSCLGGTHS